MIPKISSFFRGELPALFFPQSIHWVAGARSFCSLSTVHIRTLSTGGVHPLTSTAGSIHSKSITGGFNLHIYEDLLLILGNNSGINGLVWNWKTGELVAKFVSPSSSIC